ncbi:FkbM family methyltransferase [Candidatus Pelagibacter sp.]|nr:FkbM family methyltransferase [Candidatus Pelagibacter sp.]|tara:strand:- start:72 stop:935 length:864 start_codon:yes stop_codon:yes gene_type:complete
MTKKISYFFYKILLTLDKIFQLITKRSILNWFKDFFQKDSYKKISILNKEVNFFIPNQLTDWRIETFFTKEPETLEWIDSFEKKDKIIFWDIGANIGLYSIYSVLRNENVSTISFEPSTSNLRVLSRNISINNLENKIKILSAPLSNKENEFLTMNEGDFIEGGALNTFGENYDFAGELFDSKMKYKILGTTIKNLLDNNILEIPNYIKIDVDGIEHLILEGAGEYLKDKRIKSLSIEINEDFKEQYNKVIEIMDQNEFKLLHKKHNDEMFNDSKKFSKVFNYVFIR